MVHHKVFPPEFQIGIESLVKIHHSIYPDVPPQGIYFEALVREAFRRAKKPFTLVEASARNVSSHDLLVEKTRISLKTETGLSTHPEHISITKLCTTEREPFTAGVLIARVMEHLSRYETILMLRAIWDQPEHVIHYQLLEIPVSLLKLIKTSRPEPVGRRKRRGSLGADVFKNGEPVFHVHFDGSDGKCQVRNLAVSLCDMLSTWDVEIR